MSEIQHSTIQDGTGKRFDGGVHKYMNMSKQVGVWLSKQQGLPACRVTLHVRQIALAETLVQPLMAIDNAIPRIK